MKLVKIGKIPGIIDVSEQKVRELMKDGTWEEGEHYYSNASLNHKLFDMEVIEQWIKGSDPVSKSVMALAGKMVE